MTSDKKIHFFQVLFSTGNYEILKEFEKTGKSMQFKEFKFLVNPNTNKKFSTRTISESLKKLTCEGILENTIVEGNLRKSVGYKVSEKGKEAIMILKEAEKKYEKL